MLFNSIEFLLFLVAVGVLHFAIPARFRWFLLLVASCLFYIRFVPVYILILLFTIVVDYGAGILIEDSTCQRARKAYLATSVGSVVLTLFFFKYFGFFNANLAALAAALSWKYSIGTLQLVLPIGLSFHTFQSLSYVIEVYRRRQPAERHFGIYCLYVMYFPQLVAGPIERPQNLLPQLHDPKPFDWGRLAEGLELSLWGLFKKVVVADSLGLYVDAVYGAHGRHSGTTLLVATYFFALQIYGDFSGYSDIARGVSRIFGISLMKNFETPYFSKTLGEFWTRWHISLSTWFRDYVYIPLGGNRVPLWRQIVNLMLVFLVSGLWHGANWTFVVWGALHGVFMSLERCTVWLRNRFELKRSEGWVSRLATIAGMLLTFHVTLLAWVFFRADHVADAWDVIHRIITDHGAVFVDSTLYTSVFVALLLLGLDVYHRTTQYWDKLDERPALARCAYATALLFCVVLLGVDSGTQFIYFQF